MFPSEQLEEIVKRVFIVKPFYFDARFESESLYVVPRPYIDFENEPTWSTVQIQMWNGVADNFRFRFSGVENFENELLHHHKRWLNQTIYRIEPLIDFLKYCFPETTIQSIDSREDIIEVFVEQLGYYRRYQINKIHLTTHDFAYVFQSLLLSMIQDNFQTWNGNDWTLNDSKRRLFRPIGEPSYNTWTDGGRYLPEISGNDLVEEFQAISTLITGELSNDKGRKKATELLLNWLSESQKESYLENKTFVVIGGETGTKYRIRPEHQINIDILTGELQGKRLCIVSQNYIPLEDQLLAQKLMIENNESYFLETADLW